MNTEDQKKMECLFAWAEFYRQNKLYDQYDHCQKQIEEMRGKQQ